MPENRKNRTVALLTLGCKVNAYETQAMTEQFEAAGFSIVPFEGAADIYVVNTCSVTNTADQKSRQMLHRARRNNPDALIVAAGCYVDTEKSPDPQIDLLVGNKDKPEIVRIVEERLGMEEAKAIPHLPFSITSMEEHTRAFVKIEDGCDAFCSYCVIPYARGRVTSRGREDILREVAGLAKAGYKEVVLTGIHVSSYGRDLPDGTASDTLLLSLIKDVAAIPGICRVRLSSLEPRIITDAFIGGLKDVPEFCPHFHLSLQSGCDRTLKVMNRRYTAAEYKNACDRIRAVWPDAALTTDVIVGFPGESEEDFAESRAFVESVHFYETHIFPFSRRKGTRADTMPDQVEKAVKHERSQSLLALNKVNREAFICGFLGRELEILLEEETEMNSRAYFIGHTREYVRCAIEKGELSEGEGSGSLVTARASETQNGVLICNLNQNRL